MDGVENGQGFHCSSMEAGLSRFILRRLVRGLVALIAFQTLLFLLIQAIPYDYTVLFTGSAEIRNYVAETLGLNRPLLAQYINWMLNFFSLDLGRSYLAWPTPVLTLLIDTAPRTLILFFTGVTLAYIIGLWLGKQIAWRRGTWFETGTTIGGIAMYTSFAPWLGFALMNLFSWHLGWLPFQKMIDPNLWWLATFSLNWLLERMVITGFTTWGAIALLWWGSNRITKRHLRWIIRLLGVSISIGSLLYGWHSSGLGRFAVDVLRHMALPLLTVVLVSFGDTMLTMRTTMLETMKEEYVTMARAKGLPESRIRDHHVARNAIMPVLTRIFLNMPFVLVGSLAIEIVFQWDAMGRLIFTAIEYQDLPTLMGIMSFIAILALGAHILLDILHIYLDPRLRLADNGGPV